MAVVWAESFDYLGTGNSNLGIRGYQTVGSGSTIRDSGFLSVPARTGGRMLEISSNQNSINRLLDNPVNVCSQGCAVWWTSFNIDNDHRRTAQTFRIGGDDRAISVNINSTAGISVYQGTTLRGQSAQNIFVTGSWFWWETKVDSIAGTVEVKVNGATVLTITGLTIGTIEGFGLGSAFTLGQQRSFFDDWVVDDHDFLNDRRVVTLYPDNDGTPQQWTPSIGSTGFNLIDETTPNDSDFVAANNAGDVSEFEKNAIPIDVTSAAALVIIARAFKDSAGTSTIRLGIDSNNIVASSAEFNPGTTANYFQYIATLDPNGNIPWTKAAADLANIRITRET